jgi:uncharacterized membrane protein YfcA
MNTSSTSNRTPVPLLTAWLRFGRRALERYQRLRLWCLCTGAICVALLLQAGLGAPAFGIEWPLKVGPATTLAIFLGALLCEFFDSSLGMGYGTTLTPILLMVGFEPLQIVPAVLLSEAVSGLLAAILHQHDGNIDLVRDAQSRRVAIWLLLLSGLGAIVAVNVAVQIPRQWLTIGISVIILTMGSLILLTRTHRLRYRPVHLIAIGAVAAFNKALSGGGYGPLITAGQVVSGVGPKQAVGITSLAESVTCVIAFAAYIALHGAVELALAVPLAAGALLSVPLATLSVRHMRLDWLRAGVGVASIALGGLALARVLLR